MPKEMSLEAKIEALLFWKAEPISIKELAKILGKNTEEVTVALIHLQNSLAGRGVEIVRKDDEVSLATASGTSADKLAKANR